MRRPRTRAERDLVLVFAGLVAVVGLVTMLGTPWWWAGVACLAVSMGLVAYA